MKNKRKLKRFSWEKAPTFYAGDICVLKYLYKYREGGPQKDISRETGLTIGAISKVLEKLSDYGLIYSIKGRIKFFRLIPERRKEIGILLRGYDIGKNNELIIDAHYFVFKAEVKELPEKFLERLQEEEHWVEFIPKNWVGYKKTYLDGSVKFHKTSKGCSVIFYFRTFALNPYTADMINTEKFLEKKRLLEDRYLGLSIGKPELVGKSPYQEVAVLRDPLAIKAIKLGIKHRCIEDSHKIGGEWEERGPNAVERVNQIIRLREEIKC